ncbi:MAG: glutathione synthase [Ectothiorhodospiraceae bacterium]|jgi:glutathione synthase
MTVRLGVVMDPIGAITPYKDTTLAMLLEAQRRGWEIRYMELADLALRDGQAWCRSAPLQVRDDNYDWYERGEYEHHRMADLDVVLMRKDPPVDSEFLYATYILDAAQSQGVVVLNHPRGLRDAQEKLYAANFPQCGAPTTVSMDAQLLRAFVRDHGKAVLKPLHGMGGESVFVVAEGDPNTSVIIETLNQKGRRYVMAQKYIPEIRSGDKRILVVDGEPVPYALARVPASGETRGNIAAGGRGEGVPLSERDRWICNQVAPELAKHGLVFVGLDVIGDYLTEVNVTSPTCVRELDRIYGINISSRFFDAIQRRLDSRTD